MALGQILSLPADAAGRTPISTTTPWAFGSWVEATGYSPTDIYVIGLVFQLTNIPSLDTTTEQLFEIGIGVAGSEVTKIQIPYSFRMDTAVGYYLTPPLQVFLPEPYTIPGGTRIVVRVTDSLTSAITYNGVKIIYREGAPPVGKLVLRPNAAGSEEAIASSTSGAGLHWQDVDEVTADGDTTIVYTESATYQRDLYALPNHTTESGTINSIKICIIGRMWTDGYAKPSLKSDSTVTDGTEISLHPATYTTYSQTWTTNPATGLAWGSNWAVIDALEIGVCLKTTAGTAACTQVYVVVDYTAVVAKPRSFGYIIG